MTDITDQDRRVAHEWAASIDPERKCWSDRARAIARVILATVDAPALSERLQYRAALIDNGDPDGDTPQALRDLAADAAQMERDLTEAHAEVERLTAEWEQAQSDLAEVTNARDSLREEFDHARVEVERLTAERDAYERMYLESRAEATAIAEDIAGAESEVEHLTSVNEGLRKTDNYREFRDKFLTVQKGAESNAETPDPADAKSGEAWAANIWYGDEQYSGIAIKSAGGDWNVCRDEGTHSTYRMNEYVELIARLVPAPRVITNAEELDGLAFDTTVRVGDTAYQRGDEMLAFGGDWWYRPGDSVGVTSAELLSHGPVTVLWEPEA